MPDKPEETPTRKTVLRAKSTHVGRFRRFLRWFGSLLLLAAIFHRPLFHAAIRFALIKVASRQNVTLDVHFSGTIFTNLTVQNVHAVPNGKGPSPVERIDIESVRLDYSLLMLARHGPGEFLRAYEIKNADLVFQALPSKSAAEKEQKQSLAQGLNNLLAQPALYADAVNIDNFNITVHAPDSNTEVKGVRLYLHPWEPGYLRVDRISAPGLPVWEHLDAKTSYVKRNLFVEGLRLSPELIIDEYNFDASQRAENKGSMELKARLFGGGVELVLEGSQLPKKGENLNQSYATTLKIDAGGIDLQAAAKYFGLKTMPVARLGWLKTVFKGEPEKPNTWNGNLAARAEGFTFGKVGVDSAEAYVTFTNGTAYLTSGRVEMGPNSLLLHATAQLPNSINEFSRTEGDADLMLEASDVAAGTKSFLPIPLAGALKGGGKVGLHQRRAVADLAFSGKAIGNTAYGAGDLALKVRASKLLDIPTSSSALTGLEGQATLNAGALRYSTFTADSIAIDAAVKDDLFTLTTLNLVRGDNHATAKGTYRLPRESGGASPIDGEFAITAPSLESFGLGLKNEILAGRFDASGSVHSLGDVLNGAVDIDGSDFRFGNFKAAKLTSKIKIANNEANVEELALHIAGSDQIAVGGKVNLKPPMAYEGALLVLFKDLAVLQPLLTTFGVKEPVGGALDFSAESQGKILAGEHLGQLKLSLLKAHYGKTALSELRLAGLFGPDFAESSDFHVAMGATSLDGKLEWRDKRAKLKEINLVQGSQQALSGYIMVPFDPKNPDGPVPLDQRLGVNVNASELDIAKLMETLGQKAPVTGKVSLNLLLAGPILTPSAHLKVTARNLKSAAAAQFDAAEVDFVAHYSERELTIDSTARQRDIQPLVVKGRVPLDLEAALKKKSLDPDLPLDLSVRLPPSSLAFLPKVVPAIRSISGTAAIDAHVGGTVGKPIMKGSTDVKIEYARMKSEGVPSVGALQLNLGFTQDAVAIQKLHGDLGGGTFDVTGKVGFQKITEPVFDLHIKSDKTLVKRDDSITVRVDTDIKVAGPMAAGKVAGTVWVTQSRFFKDIDILPIALPGRPKSKSRPQPKAVASQGTFSLGPPFDKWTFDIAIKTQPNDLFRVRGNLANGAAAIDLRFGGTGAAPSLEGNVRVENLVASLPFSKLHVTRGFITFNKDELFQPKLDLTAESTLRDYHINAYIYGPATDPQVSLTSEPPLPQQDILSLLATGTTTSELTENPDVLASRAAVLLFQQLYRKVFKQKEPSENVSMLDRLSVEVGAVDSKTGREEVGASFRLGENLYLIGNVDVQGEFSGRVRYLLRFR